MSLNASHILNACDYSFDNAVQFDIIHLKCWSRGGLAQLVRCPPLRLGVQVTNPSWDLTPVTPIHE